MIFFTSDTHYYHANIIEFSKRPFGSVEHMNHSLVANWNKLVAQDDEVFHLGDVSFGPPGPTKNLLSQLNGRIRFIPGNHDKKNWVRDSRDLLLPALYERTFELGSASQKIVLCHFPLLTWNRAAHGSWMLHGHSHGSMDERNTKTKRLDVGVDGIARYFPISLVEVGQIMAKRQYEIVDSHGLRSKDNPTGGS